MDKIPGKFNSERAKEKKKEHIFHIVKKHTRYHDDIAQWWQMYKESVRRQSTKPLTEPLG